jgi:CNT family concentrative nucleoside transporter
MGRFIGVIGLLVMVGIAYALSNNRKAIRWKTVGWGMGLQFGLALLVLKTDLGLEAIDGAARLVTRLLNMSVAGATFLFGSLGTRAAAEGVNSPAREFLFAFQVLPTIIFIAALFALLYYYGIMQFIIRGLAKFMTKVMGTSGAESLNAAASIFMGQTESPLTIRPYISKLTESELMTVMTAGFATVSGAILAAYIQTGVDPRNVLMAVVMAAPAALALSKVIVPETGTPLTAGVVKLDVPRQDPNVLGALARGTTDGLGLALNVAAMLISFLAILALLDGILGGIHTLLDDWWGITYFPESLQVVLGWFFRPLAWLMGIPWNDAGTIGGLLGLRVVTNEIVAYIELAKVKDMLDPRSYAIATFALCGFANLGSIGIQIGGIGALAPDRRDDLARLGLRAMIAATLANFMSACIAGILL